MSLAKNKVVKNAGWIIGCKIVQSLIGLIISTLSARYLGPSNYGLLSYAGSIIAFVAPLAQLGIRNVLVEQIVSHPKREGEILGTTIVIGMISSAFCTVGCIAFVAIANAGERDTLLVCALYSISLIFQMLEMIQYWYQAKLLSRYTAVTSLVSYFVCSVYKIFLLVTGKNIYWFALSYSLDYLFISAVLLIIYKKLSNQKLSFSWVTAKELINRSKYYIVSGMMITVFSQTDRIMLKMMIDNSVTGYYSTAVTCVHLTDFVFLAIIDSFRPVIFESKKKDHRAFEQNMSLLYSVVIYMGLAESVALTVLAHPVVSILYGKDYLPAVPILQILVWYTAFSYMGSVRNIWMLAEGKQKYLWIINLSGASLNVIGNFTLIPVLGAAGAALASVATQVFTNYVLCIIMKPIRPTAGLIWSSLNPKRLLYVLKNFQK